MRSLKVVIYKEPKSMALDPVRYGSLIRDTESAALSSISRGGRVLELSTAPSQRHEAATLPFCTTL